MPISTKRVYDPGDPGDGFRLLAMRLWPRGIRKDHVSDWEKELGPSRELLDAYRKESVDWATFKKKYHAEMRGKKDLLRTWALRARDEQITLLCSCENPDRCHRTLLKALLEKLAKQ